jgi:diguanylate cyclase (GGDEF)-like protein/PAS domain S-box-containing protein
MQSRTHHKVNSLNERGLKSELVERSSWDFFLSGLLLTIGTFSGLLFIGWTCYEQIQAFKISQQELLTSSVASVASEIAGLIEERSRIITAIAQDQRQVLDQIIYQPDDETRIKGFEQQLKAYYPDLFAFTLADPSGNRVPDDLGERVGNYCVEEIQRYLQGDQTLFTERKGVRYYLPIIHPQPYSYHFDIMGLWHEHDQPPRILFLNFRAQLLTKLIRTYQLPGHAIYLVRADQPGLIEIGAEGTRDEMARPNRLSRQERNQIISRLDVVGTRWRAVGLFKPDLLARYNHEVVERYFGIGLVILAFWSVCMLILYRLRRHKQSAFQQLRMLNQKLEGKVADRTQELSKLSKAVAQSPVEILITDVSGIIEYINPMFTNLSGYTRREVLGTHISELKTARLNKRLLREIWQTLITGNSWHGDMMNHHKNGRQYWIRFSISPVRDNAGQITHFIGIGEDITQKREQEERIRYQAQYDDLTGLPNRALAQDRLQQAIRLAGRSDDKVALMFVDLDDFKKVNDTLGHDAGDVLIYEAAQRLRRVVRESDTVARLGGDEFLIIIQQIQGLNAIETIAQNIIEQFGSPFTLDGAEFIVTTSLGITLYPDDGTDARELMRAADLAMYQSKAEGKNTHHFFSASMEEATREYSRLEQQLHNALERGEFTVVFQPIVRLQDTRPVGCEALLRWRNPILGAVEPERFIPVAEQTGLIIPIGEFVMREACRVIAGWNRDNTAQLYVAVNLSPRQFWHGSFTERVADILRETGLAGQYLEMELTEGMIIRDHRNTGQIMHDLNDLGIKLAMDDFGTGYSSLNQLKRFPFDKLKIDRSFVQDLELDRDDDAVVRAAVALAHGLDLEIVAEGIEQERQRNMLRNEKCEYGQGFLFSKPIDAKALHEFLRYRLQMETEV